MAGGYWNKKAQTFHKDGNIKEPSQGYKKEKSNGIAVPNAGNDPKCLKIMQKTGDGGI